MGKKLTMCKQCEEDIKICNMCKFSKPISAFGTDGKLKSGKPKIKHICKECKKIKDAEYRAKMTEEDKQRYREAHQKYKQTDKYEKARSRFFKRQKQRDLESGISRRLWVFKCEDCGNGLTKRKKPAHMKCDKCKHRQWYRDNYDDLKFKRYKRPAGSVDNCKMCGIEYELTGGGNEKYCIKCRHEIEKAYKKKHKRQRAIRKKIRAIDGPVIDTKVFDRDKWRCQLCGIKVQKKTINTANEATIDHIIPLAKGGVETYSNLQTLCRSCNIKKRDNLDGQLVMML